MSKISKAFKALGMILRQPALLNHVLDDEGAKRRMVQSKYAMEQGLPLVPFGELVSAESRVKPYAFLDGGCLPTDLALLRALCVSVPVKDYLEIGTWRGESVANVAASGAQCVSINLPDEEMHTLGCSEDYISMHRFFSKDMANVQHIQAHSHHFDFGSLQRKFDLIFIDGDHHTESIMKDTRTAFSLLKNEHSVIVWHDYAISPETPRFEVLLGMLDGCPPEEQKHLYHVSNTLCAIYCRKDLPSHPLKINEKPRHYFEVLIKTEQTKD